jgi:hypothetical protein
VDGGLISEKQRGCFAKTSRLTWLEKIWAVGSGLNGSGSDQIWALDFKSNGERLDRIWAFGLGSDGHGLINSGSLDFDSAARV